jgi:sulfate adenylyltransferase large subunit
MKNNLKFVMVGHVDHGKSTLIGRLLYDTKSLPDGKIEEIEEFCKSIGKELEFGYIMDSLEEERDQNVTIDTSQMFFSTDTRDYTIIDAPGHVEFIKNMITGASQADIGVLIVDAEEGVQEQTRRHAYILQMLGFWKIIVLVNKMDKINYNEINFQNVCHQIHDLLDKVRIYNRYIIPISAKEGDNVANKSKNMSWFKGSPFLEVLDGLEMREDHIRKPLRFAVQDIYNIDDKRIIAGIVESGKIKENDEITVFPKTTRTKIKNIEKYLENTTKAESGECIGLITNDKIFVERGDVITHDYDTPTKYKKFEGYIFWLDDESLREGDRLIFRCSTQETICTIERFKKVINSSTIEKTPNQNILNNREVAEAVISTDDFVVIENFNNIKELGRFTLERLNTCAGGIITGDKY